MFESVMGTPILEVNRNTYMFHHLFQALRRVVVKVRRSVPNAMEQRCSEHVCKERRVQNTELFGRKKLRQHRDVVHAGDHDPGSAERTTTVVLHESVTSNVWTGLFMRFRELTRMSNARQPGGAPVAGGRELVRRVQPGPAVTQGTRTLLVRRVPGRIDEKLSSALLRCRFPAGSPGAGPPAAKTFIALLEKNRLSVCWNSAMASSCCRRWRDGGLRMAIDRTRRLSLQVRVSDVVHQRWIERGRVHRIGTPRAKTTEVAEGSFARTTPSGSSRSIRMVAWAAIRVVPLTKSSRPS